jgi:uncharacterized membrane protein YgcG
MVGRCTAEPAERRATAGEAGPTGGDGDATLAVQPLRQQSRQRSAPAASVAADRRSAAVLDYVHWRRRRHPNRRAVAAAQHRRRDRRARAPRAPTVAAVRRPRRPSRRAQAAPALAVPASDRRNNGARWRASPVCPPAARGTTCAVAARRRGQRRAPARPTTTPRAACARAGPRLVAAASGGGARDGPRTAALADDESGRDATGERAMPTPGAGPRRCGPRDGWRGRRGESVAPGGGGGGSSESGGGGSSDSGAGGAGGSGSRDRGARQRGRWRRLLLAHRCARQCRRWRRLLLAHRGARQNLRWRRRRLVVGDRSRRTHHCGDALTSGALRVVRLVGLGARLDLGDGGARRTRRAARTRTTLGDVLERLGVRVRDGVGSERVVDGGGDRLLLLVDRRRGGGAARRRNRCRVRIGHTTHRLTRIAINDCWWLVATCGTSWSRARRRRTSGWSRWFLATLLCIFRLYIERITNEIKLKERGILQLVQL